MPQIIAPPKKCAPKSTWIADNGMFTTGVTVEFYLGWLEYMLQYQRPEFVTVPDVVGNSKVTLSLWRMWAEQIAQMGYRIAYVAQDGSEETGIPSNADALFIGGTTDWKLGPGAREIIREAQARRLWVHVGRVNSKKRFQYFQVLGCNSVDGTHPIFEPDRAYKRIKSWQEQRTLFTF